ncbi:chemotaxis protein CheW [Bacillus alveayuensis]|jgi:purine-binding chemotaxis protein CheW|uniref:Purine-binding chemotaxis protein CheW n=1 Tax=Aeribacillus alveayuensis TaxID=279215 RepID=A0ABT9VLB1_9BACI|nr:chemotaxis protein CheW [Bacillus alveayuensis]MDQ0161757.1 purine-binding chemotaxis protein CheW [Bacillus alveayuensis]
MTKTESKELKVIVFQLQEKDYGIFVQEVKSIEKVSHITRVPGTPKFIKGVINLRGVVTPIIDLRTRLQIPEADTNEQTRIIISCKDEIDVGLVVDAAHDVIDITEDQIEPAPEVVGGVESKFIKGVTKVGKRIIMLLDLEHVLQGYGK